MAIPGEVLSRSVLGFVRSGVLCVCLLTVRRKQKRLEVCTHVRQPAQGVHALPCEARVRATTVFSLIYDPHLCPGCQFV